MIPMKILSYKRVFRAFWWHLETFWDFTSVLSKNQDFVGNTELAAQAVYVTVTCTSAFTEYTDQAAQAVYVTVTCTSAFTEYTDQGFVWIPRGELVHWKIFVQAKCPFSYY